MSKEMSVKDKQKLLKKVAKSAKTKFRGIDKQIDMFIEAITGWYLYPELQTRPTVVNLWGLTGIGKTTLVRYVINELGLSKDFTEALMQNDKNKYREISDYINYSHLQKQHVILLDEFQRYSTVDEYRKPKESIAFLDLWSLLSDGTMYNPTKINTLMLGGLDKLIRLKISLVKRILENQGEVENITGIQGETDEPLGLEYALPDSSDKFIETTEKLCVINSLGGSASMYNKSFNSLLSMITKQNSDVETFKYKLFNTIVDICRVTLLDNKEISPSTATWEEAKSFLMKNLEIFNSKDGMESLKAKKLLIIIAGNRDELYTSASGMYLNYKDVDTVYEETKDFKWYQLRNLLLDSLSPEQINRLGMTHILFPSLSSKAYKQIIRDRLDSFRKSCKKEFSTSITFDNSVNEVIYKNSVFPVQGVRPVISFIDSVITNQALKCITNGDKAPKSMSVSINEKDDTLLIKADKKEFKYTIGLEVSDIEKDIPEECRISTAAHEAGHALVGMFLWDCVSTIDMAPMIEGVLGLTSPQKNERVDNSIGSLHKYFRGNICMGLAGKAAEELVFGRDNLSKGCSSDMRHCTTLVYQMIRQWGMDSNIVSATSSDFLSTYSKTTNTEQEDLQAEYILNEEYSRAMEILKIVRPVFIEMVEYLRQHSYMPKEKAQEFLKAVKKIRSFNSLSSYSEKKLWNKFIEKN